MRMPSEADLPRGTRRDFVGLLFTIYRAADRPALHKVSSAISGLDNCRGTASIETIRKMLLGLTVPAHWDTVEAVALGLCHLSGWDLYSRILDEDTDATLRDNLRDAWHRALDEPDLIYSRRNEDPWGDAPF
jgi:hypothetical protein